MIAYAEAAPQSARARYFGALAARAGCQTDLNLAKSTPSLFFTRELQALIRPDPDNQRNFLTRIGLNLL